MFEATRSGGPRLTAAVASFLLLAVPWSPITATAQDTTPTSPAASSQPKPADASSWNIDEPHGETETVAFQTDEGTWISLDVSPDGTQIVFSLLGDLYLLPIGGGGARRITSGPAYDVQPRFSPNGQRIAYASDRSGVENLWVCERDGTNPVRVSQEKDTTVNSPTWSPDGDYLVGRKRITDTSSLGTVELWMWHVRGGQGIRITEKEKQPDAADPVFSRDGRFILFSARDSRYSYNRVVEQGIWQIKRFDRTTGQILPLTAEFGGAAAALPSPDGRRMAFVKRVRSRTILEVLDLETGLAKRVAEGLQRDNQEGFAFHGVFPGYAWMPAGDEIVATAEGKIWRWNVANGSRTAIPFTADVEQIVSKAVRFPQSLADENVRVRILRWPVESPDGRRIVFSAAGHLYAVARPTGTPVRITRSDDLEYAPAFSADGSRLAFVSWNDRVGGHIWTVGVGADGFGTPQRVTQVASQYANPSFSPDGRRIVFLKGSGSSLRSDDLSDELWHEIHWIEAAGGPSHFVIGTRNRGLNRRMPRPTFSSDGQRIYFLDDRPPEKPFTVPASVLASVKLDGTDRRDLLEFDRAEEAVVSPDGRWVAFSELHNAFVTAVPAAGDRPVKVALENPALPVARLTDEGGEWMNWADRGATVTWIYGPHYRRIALAGAFAEKPPAPPSPQTAANAPASPQLPKAEHLEISLVLRRARPTETVAYVGARIVTMNGDEVIEKGTVLVSGDRITAVGPKNRVSIPDVATIVDVSGKTIIPGLVDAHAHLHYSTLDIFPQRPWKYLANLAYGVTTTHDPSASTHESFSQSEMVAAGLIPGPRIYSTGYILYGAESAGRAIIKSLEDARHHVRRLKSLGAISVKSYMQPRRDQRQWIIQAAREEGILVVPEGGGDLEMDMTMVLDGHTTIEHSLPVAPLYKDVVTLLAKSGTAYTPTLLVSYGGLWGENWFYQNYDVWKDERLSRFVPQSVLDARARVRTMAPDDVWFFRDISASAKSIVDAGGRVCMGGHGQLQGLGPHWEMWSFVLGGMSPHQAIRASTLMPAEALGMDREIGSLTAGKLADFVVLDRNPLEKIENSDSVGLVVKNGVRYDPSELVRQTRGD